MRNETTLATMAGAALAVGLPVTLNFAMVPFAWHLWRGRSR